MDDEPQYELALLDITGNPANADNEDRSEERRVGKECTVLGWGGCWFVWGSWGFLWFFCFCLPSVDADMLSLLVDESLSSLSSLSAFAGLPAMSRSASSYWGSSSTGVWTWGVWYSSG